MGPVWWTVAGVTGVGVYVVVMELLISWLLDPSMKTLVGMIGAGALWLLGG